MVGNRIEFMDNPLPSELAQSAILRDKEYAWELSAFPRALEIAPTLGYACLGGQFWFMLPDNTLYEPFWLEANSEDRAPWGTVAGVCKSIMLRSAIVFPSANEWN